ncbi:bifunctional AP-4-A phosphorylase/ADP sulfurylase, partial [Tulasnella sp. 419]
MSSQPTKYDEIISLLPKKYESGHNVGVVHFFPSTITVHPEGGVDFQVRLCPALLQKPPAPKPHPAARELTEDEKKHGFNPFLPPYVAELYLAEFEEDGEEYVALLNKYSVVEHHFILISKDFKLQTSPLTPSDLVAAYKLLSAARRQGRHFISYFNCGPHSGSSQRHKHLQFLPLEGESGPPIEDAAKRQKLESEGRAFSISGIPYAHFIVRLPEYSSGRDSEELMDILGSTYMTLLDLAIQTVRHQDNPPPGPPAYNILLTLNHMHIIPRSKAEYTLSDGADVAVNAAGLAGMILVKTEEEREVLMKE